MSQNPNQRVAKKKTEPTNQNQQNPLQLEISMNPIQVTHHANRPDEMTNAQKKLYQQAQNMPSQPVDRNALSMSVRVARNSHASNSNQPPQPSLFPEISNGAGAYATGGGQQYQSNKRHHSDFLNNTQVHNRKQRQMLSQIDNYQQIMDRSLPNNFAQQSFIQNVNTNERSSQESSPIGTPFQKRNVKYKNVRNYNNLYEDRSQASKNVEMQDQLRLGFKRSWIISSQEQQGLPSLNNYNNYARGNMQYNSMKSCSYEQDYKGSMYNYTNQYQQLKHIKRNAEDGKAELELRQFEKPSTHHGYQGSGEAGEHVNTDPLNQYYQTANSERWRMTQNTVFLNSPHGKDFSCSSNFMDMDRTLTMIKPVLKKNCLHLQNNVILTWKSFEIQVIKNENDEKPAVEKSQVQQHKFFNPIYVPLQQAQQLLSLTPEQMETRVVRDLKLGPHGKTFLYLPQSQFNEAMHTRNESPQNRSEQSPKKTTGSKMSEFSPSKVTDKSQDSIGAVPLEDILPEEIHTSLFLLANNTDYRIIIRPPCVEYSIPAKNFLFMKTLTRSEIQEFIQDRFQGWQQLSIRCLTHFKKFTDLLAMLEKGSNLKARNPESLQRQRENSHGKRSQERKVISQNIVKVSPDQAKPESRKNQSASYVQIYVLEEQSGQIHEYSSISDFKKKRFLQFKGGLLKGCIDRNGSLGTIQVRPFAISIKCLDSDYEFRKHFKPSQWGKLIGMMQRKCIEQPENPKQLVDKICSIFQKSIALAQQNNTPQISFQIESILKTNKGEKSEMLKDDEEINQFIADLTQKIIEPSQTLQTISDLKNPNGASCESPRAISKEAVADSIDQQRKRFAVDARNASRKFLTLQKRSKMLLVPHIEKKGCSERYLVEIEYPTCSVAFQGQNYMKQLTEDDLRYLVATNFGRWKNFVMTRHFRLELNIGHDEPLPKIMEDKRGEDDLISETDPKDKYPIKEEEKQRIEVTQGRLTNWFPI